VIFFSPFMSASKSSRPIFMEDSSALIRLKDFVLVIQTQILLYNERKKVRIYS